MIKSRGLSVSHQVTLEPLHQAVSCGVRDLAAETLSFLCVHHLEDPPQLLQEVQGPQITHERRRGRLAVKQTVGVVQSFGPWRRKQTRRGSHGGGCDTVEQRGCQGEI